MMYAVASHATPNVEANMPTTANHAARSPKRVADARRPTHAPVEMMKKTMHTEIRYAVITISLTSASMKLWRSPIGPAGSSEAGESHEHRPRKLCGRGDGDAQPLTPFGGASEAAAAAANFTAGDSGWRLR